MSCNGKCEMCNINQRTYCAAQMAYYVQAEISSMKSILTTLVNNDVIKNSVNRQTQELGE